MGQIGVRQAQQRVPYKPHHLGILVGLDKQHSAVSPEERGLLIGLPQQGHVIQLESLVWSPQRLTSGAPLLDLVPILISQRAQPDLASFYHVASLHPAFMNAARRLSHLVFSLKQNGCFPLLP